MATITRGPRDALVRKVKEVLDEYERQHPGAIASLYRQNSVSIRIRISDERFMGQAKGDRHDYAWKFIADRLSDEELDDVAMLLLLAPGEQEKSFLNWEFEEPVPSVL